MGYLHGSDKAPLQRIDGCLLLSLLAAQLDLEVDVLSDSIPHQ